MFNFLLRSSAVILWPIYIYMPVMVRFRALGWMRSDISAGAAILCLLAPMLLIQYVVALLTDVREAPIPFLLSTIVIHVVVGICVMLHPPRDILVARAAG